MKKTHKRVSYCMFFLMVILILVGCNNKDHKDNFDENDINKTQEDMIDHKDPDLEEKDYEDVGDCVETGKTLDKISTKGFAIKVDLNLKGIELLKASKVTNPPGAIFYETKTIVDSNDLKYDISGTMIKSNGSYRTELETKGDIAEGMDEGKMITIYNSEEKMTYKYSETTKQGYMYKDDEQAGNGPFLEGEYDLSMLYAEGSNLQKAEVIEYEGEPVIYFEILEGRNFVASWVSLRYGMTIKTETYDGDQLASTTFVSNIKLMDEVSTYTFIPPNDIEIVDYSMNSEEDSGL